MKPTISVLAPSTETRNTGNRPWIISDEMSINMLTKPSTQMLPGSRRDDEFAPFAEDGSLMAPMGWNWSLDLMSWRGKPALVQRGAGAFGKQVNEPDPRALLGGGGWLFFKTENTRRT